MKRIVLTGGGTAGHVTPNIALLPSLKEAGYEIDYIGSYDGIEKRLMADFGVEYHGISTGKFRRYFDLKNFTDPFRVIKGYSEAKKILKSINPDVVFSKGGFVSVPVVRAAADLKIPCIIHESDMTPGLANKLCVPVATKICCNFPETISKLPADKAILTGSPIRVELSQGDKEAGYKLCGFDSSKPVIMVIGGSQGAQSVNDVIREALDKLLEKYQIVHICGKDKMDNLRLFVPGYKQFEFLKSDLKDVFAMSDVVISRAGANAICELLALNKPNILIPLSVGTRGDQILNAASFEGQGFSLVMREEDVDPISIVEAVDEVYQNRDKYINTMVGSGQMNSIKTIMQLIEEYSLKRDDNE